jgi:hypothetical protein
VRRLTALAAALLLPASAQAAERQWGIGSFERLRVEAPVAVTVASGGARATATADDPALLKRLTVSVDAGTLVVRMAGGVRPGETPQVTLTLATPRLASVALFAAAPVTVGAMAGDRVDLLVNGAGTLTVVKADARMLAATLVGPGAIRVGGRAAAARLTGNGIGGIDAAALAVDELDVVATGAGETDATARDVARVIAAQKARVTVGGRPRCVVRATGEAVVRCGVAR